jgi:hypothetical protein
MYCPIIPTPIFSPAFYDLRMSDEELIDYIEIHNDVLHQFNLHTELTLTEKYWMQLYM